MNPLTLWSHPAIKLAFAVFALFAAIRVVWLLFEVGRAAAYRRKWMKYFMVGALLASQTSVGQAQAVEQIPDSVTPSFVLVEIFTDTMPGGPDNESLLGLTVCAPNKYPVSFLNATLLLGVEEDKLPEVRAHERRHREQLAMDCEATMKAARADVALSDRLEIDASCAGYDAGLVAGTLDQDERRGKVQRLLVALFSRGSVSAETLVEYARRYCDWTPIELEPYQGMPGWTEARKP